ncbi:hypothetical protein [Stutzerimonas urumqiensis]|uniref:hypothetical protein n=1 Tax=Stutzerimonas urumqiensis TaxID=638269 RepID=UPI000EB5124E|nr:hypothetical protein [Stutzerimonas urumqiensis]
MSEKIVTSGNGFYVYECWQDASMSDPYYEVRQAGEVVKRCDQLTEAKEYVHYGTRPEHNYDD